MGLLWKYVLLVGGTLVVASAIEWACERIDRFTQPRLAEPTFHIVHVEVSNGAGVVSQDFEIGCYPTPNDIVGAPAGVPNYFRTAFPGFLVMKVAPSAYFVKWHFCRSELHDRIRDIPAPRQNFEFLVNDLIAPTISCSSRSGTEVSITSRPDIRPRAIAEAATVSEALSIVKITKIGHLASRRFQKDNLLGDRLEDTFKRPTIEPAAEQLLPSPEWSCGPVSFEDPMIFGYDPKFIPKSFRDALLRAD